MASGLKKYLDDTGRLPSDAVLGDLAITTISEGAYDRDSLEELFKDLGLDTELIPPTSTAMDAFNKATRRKDFEYDMSNGSTGYIQIDEVTSPNPNEFVGRMLTRREKVKGRPALGFDKIGEVRLYRGVRRGTNRRVDDSAARLQILLATNDPNLEMSNAEAATIREFAATIKADYEQFTQTVDGNAMRKMIRTYLRSKLDAVKVKDSVYFVPAMHQDELGRLREAMGLITGCQLDLIPLVDLKDQREHVMRAFQEDTEEALKSLAVEMQKAHTAGITPKVLIRLRGQYEEVMARVNTYASTLGESAVRTTSTSDVVTGLMASLSHALLNQR